MRYEKCLDPMMTVPAIARFLKLLTDIDDGVKVVSALTDEVAFSYDTIKLDFDKGFVDRYTGIEISNDTIVKTLKSLGFEVTLENDKFSVTVPSWRATKDVTIKADIIEEITRIYGYDNFDIHTTNAPLYPVAEEATKTVEDKIKDILVKRFSLHELHSYLWNYYDECRAIGIEPENNVKLAGATNPNIETLRKSIVPTQLCQVKTNTTYSADFGVFEIARVVNGLNADGLCDEQKKLCITLFSKAKSVEALYYELSNMLAVITDDLKHKELSFEAVEATHSYEHPVNLNAVYCDGKMLGKIGIAHPVVSKNIDKKAAIVFAEIDVADFASIEGAGIHYEEPSRFPEMEIDLTFVTDTFAPINDAIKAQNSPLVKKVGVADTYVDENGKSITVRILFSHPERTLTGDEVKAVTDAILKDLESKNIFMKN